MDAQGEVTELLAAFGQGDRRALDRLVPLVYDDLRRIARSRARSLRGGGPGVGGPDPTLNTTSLVNEAWMRLARHPGIAVHDRHHFLCVCARAMRQIVVSYARTRTAAKRGGAQDDRCLDDMQLAIGDPEAVLELDRALDRLGERDAQLMRVVECRHFAGMTGEETAEALGLSPRTVERQWVRARAWLRHDLSGGTAEGTVGAPP